MERSRGIFATSISPIGVAFVVATLASTAPLLAAPNQWNQFRGPGGAGTADATGLPVHFGDQDGGDQQHVQWKTPIHGRGWSSPVVWGEQIWMTTATEDGHKLYAVCVDLESGEIEHDLLVFEVAEPEFCHPTNSYASCTPFVEQGRVYVHFGTYGTACLDTDTGKKLWERRDFHCDHYRGPGGSPIVHGNVLFVSFDGIDVQYVVALDKRTGKVLWRRDRGIDYSTDVGDYKKAYSTPAVIDVDGRWQIVSPAAVETTAYDLATGETIWRVRHGGMNAAAVPVYDHGLVYLCVGEGKMHLAAVLPRPEGESKEAPIEWSTGRAAPRRSSPLIVGERLYMVSDDGVASCLNALTGKPVWVKRLGGAYWASPIAADGKLYLSSKEGVVNVIELGDKFNELAKNTFPAGFNATPAVADDSLILRSFTHLYRIAK